MEVIRKVIDSDSLKSIIALPPSFTGIQVELIILPADDIGASLLTSSALSNPDTKKKAVKHTAFGRLNAYANLSLISKEKNAWEKAAAEKYALH